MLTLRPVVGVNLGEPVAQRGAHPRHTAGVAAHLPGIGVVAEFPEISAHRRHRQIAGEKARQRQHRMTVAPRRAHQQRRQQQAGVEFEYPSHLGQQQAETGRTKPARCRRFAAVGRHHYFLSAARDAAEAGHGHEHVLKPLGDLRIEGEPALHQRFRRNLLDVGHHLLLQFVHHRRLHRLHIRKSEKLPGFERRAIYFDVNLHVRLLTAVLTALSQYRRDRPRDASDLTGRTRP